MINYIKILAIAIFAIFIFTNCNKNNASDEIVVEQKTTGNNDVNQLNSSTGGNNGTNQHGSSTGSKTWGRNWTWINQYLLCVQIPLDCYDEVVKKPSATVIQQFKTAVQGGTSSVAYFFNNQAWDELFPGLAGTADLDSLKSGHYDMILIHSSGSVMYYYPSGRTLPLTGSNANFVLVENHTGW